VSDLELARHIIANNGATWDQGSRLVEFDSGYIVSDGQSEKKHCLGGDVFRPEVAICAAIQSYTREFLGRVQVSDGKLYFGAWIDGNTLYLDLSEHVEELDKAAELAQERGEHAIYNCADGKSLYAVDLYHEIRDLYNVSQETVRFNGAHGLEWVEMLSLGDSYSDYGGSTLDVANSRVLEEEFGEYLTGGGEDGHSIVLYDDVPRDVLESLRDSLSYIGEMGYLSDDAVCTVERELEDEAWDSWLGHDVSASLMNMWEDKNPEPDFESDDYYTWGHDQLRFEVLVDQDETRWLFYELVAENTGWEHNATDATPLDWFSLSCTLN
jgi:hypothetical protein